MADGQAPDGDEGGIELRVEGRAAFAGALVDALRRHGVDVLAGATRPRAARPMPTTR